MDEYVYHEPDINRELTLDMLKVAIRNIALYEMNIHPFFRHHTDDEVHEMWHNPS